LVAGFTARGRIRDLLSAFGDGSFAVLVGCATPPTGNAHICSRTPTGPGETEQHMNALEVAIVIVAVVAAFYLLMASFGVIERTPRSRRGATWIDHPDDVPVADRPNEDDRAAGLPRRRLRGYASPDSPSASRRRSSGATR
jgi:hypothetical protein